MRDRDKTKKQLLDDLRQSEERFRSLAGAAPDYIVQVDRDGKILFANRTYAGVSTEDVVGTSILDWLPERFRSQVGSAVARVCDSGESEISEYEAPNEMGQELWYSAHIGPLILAGRTESAILVIRDITDRKKVEDARHENEHRIRGIVERMSSGVAVYEAVDDGEDFVFVDFNRAGEQIEKVTKDDVIGRRVTEVFPGVEEFGLLDVFRRVWRSGDPEHHPIAQYKDRRIAGWRENFVYRLPSGEVVTVYDDVTERKRAEETLKFLVRELDHRVKNTLATIDSLAEQTLQSSASLAEFGEAFRGRIRALARMHEMGAEYRWGPLRIEELIELTVSPFCRDGEHLWVRGDTLMLSPASVRAVGMALHELATNAAKYGALSTPGGHVEVCWRVDSIPAGDRLRIKWAESGGPPVLNPSRRGLGTVLIEEGIAYELGGDVKIEYPVAGVQCEISLPVPLPAEEP